MGRKGKKTQSAAHDVLETEVDVSAIDSRSNRGQSTQLAQESAGSVISDDTEDAKAGQSEACNRCVELELALAEARAAAFNELDTITTNTLGETAGQPDRVSSELEQARRDLDDVSVREQHLVARISELETRVGSLVRSNEELESTLEECVQQRDALHAVQLNDDNGESSDERSDLEMVSRLSTLEALLARRDEELREQAEVRHELETRVKSRDSVVERLQRQMEDLARQLASENHEFTSEELAVRDGLVEERRLRVEAEAFAKHLQELLGEARSGRAVEASRLSDIQSQLEEQASHTATAKWQSDALTKQIESMRRELLTVNTEVDRCHAQAELRDSTLSRLETVHQALQDEYAAVVTKLSAMADSVASAEMQGRNVETRLKHLLADERARFAQDKVAISQQLVVSSRHHAQEIACLSNQLKVTINDRDLARANWATEERRAIAAETALQQARHIAESFERRSASAIEDTVHDASLRESELVTLCQQLQANLRERESQCTNLQSELVATCADRDRLASSLQHWADCRETANRKVNEARAEVKKWVSRIDDAKHQLEKIDNQREAQLRSAEARILAAEADSRNAVLETSNRVAEIVNLKYDLWNLRMKAEAKPEFTSVTSSLKHTSEWNVKTEEHLRSRDDNIWAELSAERDAALFSAKLSQQAKLESDAQAERTIRALKGTEDAIIALLSDLMLRIDPDSGTGAAVVSAALPAGLLHLLRPAERRAGEGILASNGIEADIADKLLAASDGIEHLRSIVESQIATIESLRAQAFTNECSSLEHGSSQTLRRQTTAHALHQLIRNTVSVASSDGSNVVGIDRATLLAIEDTSRRLELGLPMDASLVNASNFFIQNEMQEALPDASQQTADVQHALHSFALVVQDLPLWVRSDDMWSPFDDAPFPDPLQETGLLAAPRVIAAVPMQPLPTVPTAVDSGTTEKSFHASHEGTSLSISALSVSPVRPLGSIVNDTLLPPFVAFDGLSSPNPSIRIQQHSHSTQSPTHSSKLSEPLAPPTSLGKLQHQGEGVSNDSSINMEQLATDTRLLVKEHVRRLTGQTESLLSSLELEIGTLKDELAALSPIDDSARLSNRVLETRVAEATAQTKQEALIANEKLRKVEEETRAISAAATVSRKSSERELENISMLCVRWERAAQAAETRADALAARANQIESELRAQCRTTDAMLDRARLAETKASDISAGADAKFQRAEAEIAALNTRIAQLSAECRSLQTSNGGARVQAVESRAALAEERCERLGLQLQQMTDALSNNRATAVTEAATARRNLIEAETKCEALEQSVAKTERNERLAKEQLTDCKETSKQEQRRLKQDLEDWKQRYSEELETSKAAIEDAETRAKVAEAETASEHMRGTRLEGLLARERELRSSEVAGLRADATAAVQRALTVEEELTKKAATALGAREALERSVEERLDRSFKAEKDMRAEVEAFALREARAAERQTETEYQLSVTKDALSRLEEETTALRAELSDLRLRTVHDAAMQQAVIDAMAFKCESAKRRAATAEANVAPIRASATEVTTLRVALTDAESRETQLYVAQEELKTRISTLEADIRAANAVSSSLDAALQTEKQANARLSSSARVECDELKALLSSAKREVEQLRARVADGEVPFSQIAVVEQDKAALTQALLTAEHKRDEALTQSAGSFAALRALEERQACNVEDTANLKLELQQMKENMVQADARAEAAMKAAQEAEIELQRCQSASETVVAHATHATTEAIKAAQCADAATAASRELVERDRVHSSRLVELEDALEGMTTQAMSGERFASKMQISAETVFQQQLQTEELLSQSEARCEELTMRMRSMSIEHTSSTERLCAERDRLHALVTQLTTEVRISESDRQVMLASFSPTRSTGSPNPL